MSSNTSPQNHDHSYVYQELTKNDNGTYNLVNSIAYILYKKKKIEWYAQKNGSPTPEEIRNFHQIHMMPSTLDQLRAQATEIVTDVLGETFNKKVEEVELEFKSSNESLMQSDIALIKQSLAANHVIVTRDIAANKTQLTTNQSELLGKLESGKGITGFLWEMGKSTIVTVLTTLVIWFLLSALNGRGEQGKLEDKIYNQAKGSTQTQPTSEPNATQ